LTLHKRLSTNHIIFCCDGGIDTPSVIITGRLKTRDWKTRHQIAGVENAGVAQYGKLKSPLFNIVTSVLQQPIELM